MVRAGSACAISKSAPSGDCSSRSTPFYSLEDFPLPGPVFIHEEECERYPEHAGFPADLLSHALTLEAYARGRVLRAEERVAGEGVEGAIGRLLDRDDVDYLHVRDTAAGCYDFPIERA
jgi:hypothetical protein